MLCRVEGVVAHVCRCKCKGEVAKIALCEYGAPVVVIKPMGTVVAVGCNPLTGKQTSNFAENRQYRVLKVSAVSSESVDWAYQ